MALMISSNMPSTQDADFMDIDIDMDLDENGPAIDDEFQLEEGEEPSFVPSTLQITESNVIPAIYTEDPTTEPQLEKVYIRGVDDFHTNDIHAFVHDQIPDVEVHIQWIDDTSANIVFKDKHAAREGILNFVAQPTTTEAIAASPFELRKAKPLASRPASMLMVRVAQVGDRKRKNARDASRYYLLHPGEDPKERMRHEFANGRATRENGEYRRRRFDENEHRRRRDKDHNTEETEFAASMYDDAPAIESGNNGARGRDLFSRITKARRRSASPGGRQNSDDIDLSDSDDGRLRRRRNGYRDRSDRPPPYTRRDPDPYPKTNTGKELFGDTLSRREGTLHSDKIDLLPSPNIPTGPRASNPADARANAAAAKRLKADLLSATQTSPRSHHRRSHAMDAKNAEDLSERFGRKSVSMDSTKSGVGIGNTAVELFPSANQGLRIKGVAETVQGITIAGSAGIRIKGRAEVKKLFSERYERGNEGKELFDAPVREKRERRRAGDLFD